MRAVLLPIIAVLAGCGERAAPEPAPSMSVEPATGEVRARIVPPGEEAVTLRSGARVPIILPPGFLIYPGARVISNSVAERGGSRRILIVFETPDPLAEVMTFYRGQADAAGAVLTLDLGGPEQASIGGRLPSGGMLSITARQGATATRVEFAHN